MLGVGDKAPEFKAPCSTGVDLVLADVLKLGPVVLYFYNQDFTPGCTAQARRFRDSAQELTALGAQVVGVSKDSVESHQAFVKRLTLGFPLVADEDRRIMKAFGVRSLFGFVDRVTFVIDQDGVIRAATRSLLNMDQHVDVAVDALKAIRERLPAVPQPQVS